MLKLTRKFMLHTVILIGVLLLQVTGVFNNPNVEINATIPTLNTSWMTLITNSASFVAFVIYILLFVWLDIKERRKLSLITLEFLLSLIAGMVVIGFLKVITGVPRPGETPLQTSFAQAIANADYFSFPSGHATRASILAYMLSIRFPRYAVLWWGYAVLIAVSRLFLHVHWFSDVLFGILLGPWVFAVVRATEDLWLPVYRLVIRKLKLGVFDVE
ncbi:phosphatase PAP2 family protein [Thermococcus aciditolerans]|uniref:Phosphatase PAP2 family protein n=1 Tax=Thermococcus aciditolerans TaxID=2598455 RepID=A0A5C0SIJ1_9EURY|nr:phosphatase PAP2 family protein [Thermococcus aciditolerans]QEK14131.1 phosphatase PAP2 family protein [Thermococcus aciditolerans]